MTLVVGAPVRVGSKLHLGAFIVSPAGTVDVYTKHYLGAFAAGDNPGGPTPPPEASVFQPGDQNPLVRFAGNTAAVAVCADTGRPSHPQQVAERGARTYLASMFVIPAHLENDATNLRTYAARHSMVVAFANYGGPSGGMPSGGGSAIWSDRGDLLVKLDPIGAGVAVAVEGPAGWRTSTEALS
jgi:predicted amidohydrolase